jgi:hypothetical protein
MRTVSPFGPSWGKAGAGRNEADNGFEADGGFGGWKIFVDEISPAAGPVLDGDEVGIGGLPVSRPGNLIRTVSGGLSVASGGFGDGGTGNSIRTVSFFGWSGSAISLGAIDQKSPGLSRANLAAQKNVTGATPEDHSRGFP